MSRGLALFFGVALLCHGGVARAGDGGLFFQPLSVSSRCLGGVGKPGAVVKKWVDGAIDLDEGQLAFVSARPGTWLRASASGLRMGLAFGDRPASSAIVWAKGEGASAHLRVPIYSSAKWIVLGRKGSGEVNAEVAVSRHQPMRWFRFEEDFLDWVRRGGDPPAVRGAKAEHLIRMVDELQQALPYADREQMLEWLLQRLREQAMEGTRLRKPFYRRATVESSAARGAVARRGAMEIKAGAALELRPEPDSVLRLRLRASAGVETRVELRMGDALLRVFEWGGWEAGREDGWTRYARVHRVLYSAVATPFRLRVVRGKVRVAFDAAKRVSSLFELLGPGLQQYRGYPAEERSSLGLANALQRSGGLHTARVGAQRYANDSRQPAMARAFVAAELVHWARSVQEAVEAAEIALDPQLGLGATLQLRVLERLLALNAELSGPRCRAPPRPVAEGLALFARAMTGVLCGSDGGQRPADLATLAQVARGFPGQERLRKLARAAASASARWVAASTVTEVPNTVAWVEPSDGRADGLCRIQGTRHQRWTVLKPGRTAIDVGTPDESWNRIVTRAADYRDDWEGYLMLEKAGKLSWY